MSTSSRNNHIHWLCSNCGQIFTYTTKSQMKHPDWPICDDCFEDWLLETDQELLASLRQAKRDVKEGRVYTLDEVLDDWRDDG